MAEHAIDAPHTNWLLSTAHSYLGQNMAAPAITLLELLNALQPNNQQALRMLAYGYLLAAQFHKVLEATAALESLNQSDAEQTAYVHLLRARALWGLGDSDASKDAFRLYIRSAPHLTPSS